MRVSLVGVSSAFGSLEVLRDISLDISPGTITAVLGTNGSGKTTLLRLLAGILAPTRGEVRYDEAVLTRRRLDLRRRAMFIADAPLVLPESALISWIGTCLRVYEVERPDVEAAVSRLLDDLDLATMAGIPLANLSRGQVYKAALASLLAVDPDLWLLDEPFASGMDPAALSLFTDAARAAAGRGRSVVFGTQMLDLATRLADRVIVLHGAGVARSGSMQDIAADGEGLHAMFEQLRRGRV